MKVPVGVSLQPRRVLARSCGWRNCPESRAPGSRPGSLQPGCPGKPGTPAGGVSPGSRPGPVRSAHSGRQRGWWYHAGCIHGSGWRGLSRVQGQAGLGALQGLDLRLLIQAYNRACARCGALWCGPDPPPAPCAGWPSGRPRPGAVAAGGSAPPASAFPRPAGASDRATGRHPGLRITLLPAPHRDLALAGVLHDGGGPQALRRGQHDGAAPHMFLRRHGRGYQGLQADAVGRRTLAFHRAGHGVSLGVWCSAIASHNSRLL